METATATETVSETIKNANKIKKYNFREVATAYLFTGPSFLGFMAFVLIPVIWVCYTSFQNYDVFTGKSVFSGIANYKEIFSDARSMSALKNTLWYTVFCTVGNTSIGLVLAVLVDDILPHRISVFFRSIYFFPSLIGLVFVSIIWQSFFQTDLGLINYYLNQLGFHNIGWLSSQSFSKISVLILDVWKNSGMSMLLILAGLQNVDKSLLEAAEIDGANAFQKLIKIIIPVASPQIFFVSIMNATGALRIFESAYVLTNGGPGDSSRSLVMLITEKAFSSFKYGEAAALSILLLLLIAVVTLIQFVGSRKWVHYD